MGVKRGDSGSSCDSAPTEICQGLPYSHGDYLCTFPIVCPVQHYLVWRVFLKVLDHQVYKCFSPQKRTTSEAWWRHQVTHVLSSRSSFSTQFSCPQSSLSSPHVLSPRSILSLVKTLWKNVICQARENPSNTRGGGKIHAVDSQAWRP